MSTQPDISDRPVKLTIEKTLAASPGEIYTAWTENFDQWFAQQGTLRMTAEEGALYFFETHFEETRHPHYGRFLRLVPNELVEQTWVTGMPGTQGAETVLRVELAAVSDGTNVTLNHAGFYDDETMKGHRDAWPLALDLLENYLTGK